MHWSPPPELAPWVGWLVLVQGLGLASAFTTRLFRDSRRLHWFHAFFFACLGLVGAAMIHGLWLGPNYWSSCGATFCAMVLAAVWDVRGSQPAAGGETLARSVSEALGERPA